MERPRRKWGLILGGGTFLGAVQVPIVERLWADLGPPVGIAGVSVGAVNAILLGENRVAELRAEWMSIAGPEDFISSQIDVWNGMKSLGPTRKRLVERRAGMKLTIPTWAGLVDVDGDSYQQIALHLLQDVGHRWDAVIGSASQPWPIMEPAFFRGRLVMDGGAGGRVLPTLPNWAECDEIHAISCSPLGDNRRRPATKNSHPGRRSALTAFRRLLGRQADEDVEDLRDTCAKDVPTYLYAPISWEEVGDPFEAEPEDIARRLATGVAMYDRREQLAPTAPIRGPR